jgi:Uma2 family endonuclease
LVARLRPSTSGWVNERREAAAGQKEFDATVVLALNRESALEGAAVLSTGVQAMVATLPELIDPFAELGHRAEDFELVRGVLREAEAMGGLHGASTVDLQTDINVFVRAHDLGMVFSADTQFLLIDTPRTILRPDISFISKDRLPDELWVGIIPLAPDLAVEVASPSNRQVELIDKVALYLAGGTRLVWVVRPQQQTVTIFRPDEPERIVTRDDELEGGEVLPGFRLPLTNLFRPRGRFSS